MVCNQIRQTFANPNRTTGTIQLGFVTLIDGNIIEVGHSQMIIPSKPGDPNFETVLRNVLKNISCDPETYKRMWKALSKETIQFAKSLGADLNGVHRIFRAEKPKFTGLVVHSGFVIVSDEGEIIGAGHSRRNTPAKPSDSDFEIVLENALGSIAGDPKTYARMWEALNENSINVADYFGFNKNGIIPITGECASSYEDYVNPTKSIHDMTFEELAEYIKAQETSDEGMEGPNGTIGFRL